MAHKVGYNITTISWRQCYFSLVRLSHQNLLLGMWDGLSASDSPNAFDKAVDHFIGQLPILLVSMGERNEL